MLSKMAEFPSFLWLNDSPSHIYTLLTAQRVKNLPVMWETQVRFKKKGMATHSSVLAWRIPQTSLSMGLQRVGHDWATVTNWLCFILSSIHRHLGCFHALAIINNPAVNRCRYLFEFKFSFPSAKYPEVELLDHMIVLFLVFWGIFILFYIVATPVYILTYTR